LPDPAFITLGSNIEPEEHLPAAIEMLLETMGSLTVSRAYRNPAMGPTIQADFLNAAALFWTDEEPQLIRSVLKRIESDLGRVRTEDKFAPRTIDLDLSLLGSQVICNSDFTLPDPDLLKHEHIAIPLAEIDPDFIHPITDEPLQVIAERMRPVRNLQVDENLSQIILNIAKQIP
jgi:2-amino-4-hydroxy-6-hydroxymethyldihydropteridine diphosphokinase